MQYWVAGVMLVCAAASIVATPVVFAKLSVAQPPSTTELVVPGVLTTALALWGAFWLRKGWNLLRKPGIDPA